MKELFFKSIGARNNIKTENVLDLILGLLILASIYPEKKVKLNRTHRYELEPVKITIKKCKREGSRYFKTKENFV